MGRKRRSFGVLGVMTLAGVVAGCEPAPSYSWDFELVSGNATGTDGGNASVWDAPLAVSPDGTKIAFLTLASDLGPTDTNGRLDLYVRDLTTATTVLVTVNAAGTDSTPEGVLPENARSFFSADGTRIAFGSAAPGLVATDTNEVADVFVRDLTAGVTTLVSADAAGTDSANRSSSLADLSDDGTKVVFNSEADDLGPTVTPSGFDVYLRDLTTGTTSLVSSRPDGSDSQSDSFGGDISPDGTEVAFVSRDTLDPADTVGGGDVYVRDLAAGSTAVVSVGAVPPGGIGNHQADDPVFSPDGERIAFEVESFIVTPTPVVVTGIFVVGADGSDPDLVTVDEAGTGEGDGHSFDPSFSPDGSKVAFTSHASDLVPNDPDPSPGDPFGSLDVFVRDLTAGTTELVSVGLDGMSAGGWNESDDVVFGPDGTEVVFTSSASNLVAHDTNGVGDVFLRDLEAGTTTLVSTNVEGTDSIELGADRGSFVGPGARIAFVTTSGELGPTDGNEAGDIYVAIGRRADLAAGLADTPDPVPSGGELTYELELSNTGPDRAEAARSILVLPAGVELVHAEPSVGACLEPPAEHPGVVLCELGDVAAGATAEVTVVVDVTAAAGSALTVRAAVSSATVDPRPDDNSVSAETLVG